MTPSVASLDEGRIAVREDVLRGRSKFATEGAIPSGTVGTPAPEVGWTGERAGLLVQDERQGLGGHQKDLARPVPVRGLNLVPFHEVTVSGEF